MSQRTRCKYCDNYVVPTSDGRCAGCDLPLVTVWEKWQILAAREDVFSVGLHYTDGTNDGVGPGWEAGVGLHEDGPTIHYADTPEEAMQAVLDEMAP